MRRRPKNAVFDYDVCLSFAGEDRSYVGQVAEKLKDEGVRVFYDAYEQLDLWGKDLYEHLDDVYRNRAQYCVIFVSKHYARKLWPNHERKSAQERALRENQEYILPALFDDAELPGLRKTVGHVSLADLQADAFAELIIKKIGKAERRNYLPPTPDVLFEVLSVRPGEAMELASSHAHHFLNALNRMTYDEREVVFHIFQEGCREELPQNIHINADLLRRATGFPFSKIIRLLERLPSLGLFSRLREDDEHAGQLGTAQYIVLEWHDLTDLGENDGNCTQVASAMISCATDGLCAEHGMEALRRLDFSQLGTRTANKDQHDESEYKSD